MSSGSFDAFTSGGSLRDPVPGHPPRPLPPPLPLPQSSRPLPPPPARGSRPAPIPRPVPIPVPKPIPLPPADRSVVDPQRRPTEVPPDQLPPTTWSEKLRELMSRRELLVTTISSIAHMVLIIILALLSFANTKNRLPVLVASPDVETFVPDVIESPPMETPTVAAGPQMRALTPPQAMVKAPINVGVSTAPKTVMSLNDMILHDSTKVGGAAGTDSVSFFGSAVVANKVIFVVDNSQSMQGQRFARAKEELLTAVSNLNTRQRFYVFFFSDRDYPMLGAKAPPGLIGLDSKSWEALFGWVNQLDLYGDTLAESALRKAYAMKPDVIYLLTDGDFGDNTFEFMMKMKYSKTRVNTIGFQTTDTGREVLKKIAETLKGEYTEVR